MKPYVIAILSASLVSTAAVAEQSSPPAAAQPSITLDGGEAEVNRKRAENRKNANDIICVREPELGTRLPRKKTCMTRAQMNQRKMHDRDWIERSQASRPDNGP